MAERNRYFVYKYDPKWVEYIVSEEGKNQIQYALYELIEIHVQTAIKLFFKYYVSSIEKEPINQDIVNKIQTIIINNKDLIVKTLYTALLEVKYLQITSIKDLSFWTRDILWTDLFIPYLYIRLRQRKKLLKREREDLNNINNIILNLSLLQTYLKDLIRLYEDTGLDIPFIEFIDLIDNTASINSIITIFEKYSYLFLYEKHRDIRWDYSVDLNYVLHLLQVHNLSKQSSKDIISFLIKYFEEYGGNISWMEFAEDSRSVNNVYLVYLLIYSFFQEYNISVFEEFFQFYYYSSNRRYNAYLFKYMLYIVYYYFYKDKDLNINQKLSQSEIINMVNSGIINHIEVSDSVYKIIAGIVMFLFDTDNFSAVTSLNVSIHKSLLLFLGIYVLFLESNKLSATLYNTSIQTSSNYLYVFLRYLFDSEEFFIKEFLQTIFTKFKNQIQQITLLSSNGMVFMLILYNIMHIFGDSIVLPYIFLLSKDMQYYIKLLQQILLNSQLNLFEVIHKIPLSFLSNFFLHPIFFTTLFKYFKSEYAEFFEYIGIIVSESSFLNNEINIKNLHKVLNIYRRPYKFDQQTKDIYNLCQNKKYDVSILLNLLLHNKKNIIKIYINKQTPNYFTYNFDVLFASLYEIDKDREKHKEIYKQLANLYLSIEEIQDWIHQYSDVPYLKFKFYSEILGIGEFK